MADDWQIGDLALRIHTSEPCPKCGQVPDCPGTIRRVERVGSDERGLYLILEGREEPDHCVGREWHWGDYPPHYRKIHPHAPDAEDEETIRLLNRAPVTEEV